MFPDCLKHLGSRLVEVVIVLTFLLLGSKAPHADTEGAQPMMTHLEGVSGLKLECDNVLEQRAILELFERRELFPQVLEEHPGHKVFRSLVHLLSDL